MDANAAIPGGVTMENGYVPGSTVASRALTVAAEIAAIDPVRSSNMKWILVNFGANDVSASPVEATWKANLSTIIDTMNAQWPLAKVYIMRPWRRGYAAECDSLATWISDVISSRSAWAFVGPDERVFLEGGDDGATYTYDGVHPNAAGNVLTANEWYTTMGY